MYLKIQNIETEISNKDTKYQKTYISCKRIITNIEDAIDGYTHIVNWKVGLI